MKNASQMTVIGLVLTTGISLCTPMTASADGIQQNKNLWRNVATGAALLTGIGIANHNGAETAVGAIGTLVGLTQYEQDRHEQSVEQNGWSGQNCDGCTPRQNVTVGVDLGRPGRYGGHDTYQPRQAFSGVKDRDGRNGGAFQQRGNDAGQSFAQRWQNQSGEQFSR